MKSPVASHAAPSYNSNAPVVELYLNVPVAGEPDLCAVVPTGIANPVVPKILNSPDSALIIISSLAVVDVSVVSSAVILPKVDAEPLPTPNVPVYLAPDI